MKNTQAKELASKEYFELGIGGRSISAYHRPGHARGEYAVRLYLPAGELLPFERCYAYEGNDLNAARGAWKRVTTEWNALYAKEAAARAA